MNEFNFFFDAGHGWLRVTPEDITRVGLSRLALSEYSYTDGNFLFLEEDMDMGLFCAAYRAKYGRDPGFVEWDEGDRSSIRDLPRLPRCIMSYEMRVELYQRLSATTPVAA